MIYEDDRDYTQHFEALESARQLFSSDLPNSQGHKYLQSRGIKDKTLEKFELGYATEGWTRLVDALIKRFDQEVLEETQLARSTEQGKLYSKFRNRVMFPLRNTRGMTAGFSGRVVNQDDQPKYDHTINPLYKKGANLYGETENKEGIVRANHAIIVEGYMDLIRCSQEGIENTLAIGGTILTEDHSQLLRRLVPSREIILCLDGDEAGVRATLKGIETLLPEYNLTVAPITKEEKDPARIFETGGDLRQVIERRRDAFEFYVDTTWDRRTDLYSIMMEKFLVKTAKVLLRAPERDWLRHKETLQRITRIEGELIETALETCHQYTENGDWKG